jgi:hypothetical protein
MPSPVSAGRLAWAMEKLGRAFPGSVPTPEQMAGVTELWRELLDRHEWVTDPVFVGGVYAIVWEHKGDFLPGPASVLDFFREAERKARAADAKRELEQLEHQEAEVRAAAAGLTTGARRWRDRPGPDKAAFLLRHLAMGKLRARYGVRVTDWEGHLIPFEPPGGEEELAAMEEQIRRSGFLRRALARTAAGQDVTPEQFIEASQHPTPRSDR